VAGSRDAQEFRRSRRRPGFRFLLGGLIALLILFPELEQVARPLILVMPIAFVFVVGVMVAEGGRADDRKALLIAAIQLGCTLMSLFVRDLDGPYYLIAVSSALLATVILMLFATNCILRYVLRARMISRDQIYAGICMYLMLGFAFGSIFYLLYVLNPNSFAESSPNSRPLDLMYFSFVTLATLGYGDIVPRTNLARSVAVLEATAGMLYIAVFMARLVSMYSTSDERN
jgi:hypothetical protein